MEQLNPIIGVLAFVLLHNVMTDHEEDSNYFKQLRNGIYSISTYLSKGRRYYVQKLSIPMPRCVGSTGPDH